VWGITCWETFAISTALAAYSDGQHFPACIELVIVLESSQKIAAVLHREAGNSR
jgi:hypothetical protein